MQADKIQCQCGELADPVHKTTGENGERLKEPQLLGWYCPHCEFFTKPTGREFTLGIPEKR